MTAASADAAAEKVADVREDLRDIAESDLPAARWARELLGLLDDHEPIDGPGGGG